MPSTKLYKRISSIAAIVILCAIGALWLHGPNFKHGPYWDLIAPRYSGNVAAHQRGDEMQRWYDWMLDQPHAQFVLERETVLGLQQVRHNLGKSVSYEQAIKNIVEKARESFGAAFPIDTNSELAIHYLSSKNKYSFGRCRKAEKQPQEYAEYSCLYGVAVRVFLEPTDVKGETFDPASRMAVFAVYNVRVKADAHKKIKHISVSSSGFEAASLPSI